MAEVEQILAGLEAEDVDIDHLGDQVKRAVTLITVCREKLEKTDREVRDLVAGLQEDGAAAPAAAADAADGEDKDLPF
jgi:exodeoxyribonuclease VII small subunit